MLTQKRMIIYWLMFCCLICQPHVHAQQARKKVGLVLGGGGAKGAAEIGVLKVLEEADIPHRLYCRNQHRCHCRWIICHRL